MIINLGDKPTKARNYPIKSRDFDCVFLGLIQTIRLGQFCVCGFHLKCIVNDHKVAHRSYAEGKYFGKSVLFWKDRAVSKSSVCPAGGWGDYLLVDQNRLNSLLSLQKLITLLGISDDRTESE